MKSRLIIDNEGNLRVFWYTKPIIGMCNNSQFQVAFVCSDNCKVGFMSINN